MKRTIAAVALTVTGIGLMAAPAIADDGTHREVVCHALGNGGFVAVPPDQASAHLPKHEDDGDFALKVTYNPDTDGGWNDVKDGFDTQCNAVVVVTPPPVTQTVTAPPVTETKTVTAPPVTETEVVTPTETVTSTAPAVTKTETVTPTETTTVTAPPVKDVVTLPGPTHTVQIPGPESVVPVKVAGPVVTKTVVGPATTETVKAPGDKVVVNEQGEVQSVQRTTLPYTGFNLTIFLVGLCLLLAGTTLGFGAKLVQVRAH